MEHRAVMRAAVQQVEIRHPVLAAADRLARIVAECASRLARASLIHGNRCAQLPSEKAHPLAPPARHETVSVVLDLVHPGGALGRPLCRSWQAGGNGVQRQEPGPPPQHGGQSIPGRRALGAAARRGHPAAGGSTAVRVVDPASGHAGDSCQALASEFHCANTQSLKADPISASTRMRERRAARCPCLQVSSLTFLTLQPGARYRFVMCRPVHSPSRGRTLELVSSKQTGNLSSALRLFVLEHHLARRARRWAQAEQTEHHAPQ